MSTIPEEKYDRIDSFETLSPREQVFGTIAVILVILLAIALQSL